MPSTHLLGGVVAKQAKYTYHCLNLPSTHIIDSTCPFQVGELEKALQEAEGAAEQLQDRADAAEDALAEARADLARQTATNKTLLSKLAASRVSMQFSVYPCCTCIISARSEHILVNLFLLSWLFQPGSTTDVQLLKP